MTHTLKTWPPFFEAVASGVKTFELRRDDRPYTVGDVLQLQEWAPDTGTHTGRTVDRAIAYIVRDAPHFGLMPGFVILGIGPVPKPIPTLDLPPAPEGMRWARAFNRDAKFHLWREHPNAHPGLRWRRECVPYGTKHNADLTDKVTPSSRACPACLAIASKGAQ